MMKRAWRRMAVPLIFIVLASFLNYSYALTPEQVLQLKKAGVSDKTIQLMLKQEADAREQDAFNRLGTHEIKGADGKVRTVYSTGDSTIDREEKEKVDNAWRMLQNMMIMDKSGTRKRQ